MRFLIQTLMFLMFFVSSAMALDVNSIRVGAHPDKIRVVMDLSTVPDYKVFALSNPYRLVIDMPSLNWKAGTVKHADVGHIVDVREGALHAGISRVVFDLKKPVELKSVFIIGKDGNKNPRLVIDYTAVSASRFDQIKGKAFGKLDNNGTNKMLGAKPLSQPVSSIPLPAVKQTKAVQAPATAPVSQNYDAPPVPVTKPFSTNTNTASTVPAAPKKRARKPVIVIDAGHGGVDPGAIAANGMFEKNITLALAKDLKKLLEASGQYTVHLTRTSDKYIRLHKRVAYARTREGDLFISLHADSLPRPNVRGISVYTLSEKASDAQTAKLAARENKADQIAGIDLSEEDQEVANILLALAMRDTMNQSKFFANTVVKAMQSDRLKLLENPHRYAGFAVLKAPEIPSVLIEAGFLSNNNEAAMLSKPSYRSKVARAIKKAIDNYFETVFRNEDL